MWGESKRTAHCEKKRKKKSQLPTEGKEKGRR
jgi:hypothetical protein